MMAKQRQKKRKLFLLLCPQTFTTIFWIHSQYKLKTLCVYNIWITKKVGFTLKLIIVNHFLFNSRKFWLRYSENKINRNYLIYYNRIQNIIYTFLNKNLKKFHNITTILWLYYNKSNIHPHFNSAVKLH